MLSIKQTLNKILDQLNIVPQLRSWSNIATPNASTYYNCATFTLKPNSKYLILAYNGNGLGTAVTCTCNFTVVSGTAKLNISASGKNNAGSGNPALGWAYVETGSSPVTYAIRGYSYDTSVTNLNGAAIAIRLVGGGAA